MMPQPLHSPDPVARDFFWSPKRMMLMKGRHYATINEIKAISNEELQNLKHNNLFEVWIKTLMQVCNISWGLRSKGQNIYPLINK